MVVVGFTRNPNLDLLEDHLINVYSDLCRRLSRTCPFWRSSSRLISIAYTYLLAKKLAVRNGRGYDKVCYRRGACQARPGAIPCLRTTFILTLSNSANSRSPLSLDAWWSAMVLWARLVFSLAIPQISSHLNTFPPSLTIMLSP